MALNDIAGRPKNDSSTLWGIGRVISQRAAQRSACPLSAKKSSRRLCMVGARKRRGVAVLAVLVLVLFVLVLFLLFLLFVLLLVLAVVLLRRLRG